jgi:hypothetical protein
MALTPFGMMLVRPILVSAYFSLIPLCKATKSMSTERTSSLYLGRYVCEVLHCPSN